MCITALFIATAVVFVAKGITLYNANQTPKARKHVLIGILAFFVGLGSSIFLYPEAVNAPEVSQEQSGEAGDEDAETEVSDADETNVTDEDTEETVDGDTGESEADSDAVDTPAEAEEAVEGNEGAVADVEPEETNAEEVDEAPLDEDDEDAGNFSIAIPESDEDTE